MKERVFSVGTLIPGRAVVQVTTNPIKKQENNRVSIIKQPDPIVVMQNGTKYEILPEKGKLLDAALNQGKYLQYKCQKGTCGQCTVKVLQGQGLSAPNEQEQKKLSKELTNGYRLACQAEIL